MLLRLTFVKRFTSDGFLYRRERAYRMDEEQATRLLGVTVRDMPVFKMVSEDDLPEDVKIIELVEEEDEPAPPPPKPKQRKVSEKKDAAPKKKTVAKKEPTRLKKPPADDNIEMV